MFVADTFGVAAPPFPVSASNNDPNMRTEELLLPLVVLRPRGILREEEDKDKKEDKEPLPPRDDETTTVLEHAEATKRMYLYSPSRCALTSS